jgi:glycosyltransferase involved in cell wall biosynthesis
MTPLRIAIVVPGRLHAFELAAALQKQGHEVHVFSNYPVSEALKFGLNPKTYAGNVLNRVALRLCLNVFGVARFQSLRDRFICNWLDRWALRKIKKLPCLDVIHAFSGVALHILQYAKEKNIYSQVLRGSAHIETQTALLLSEAKRSGGVADIPSRWMRQREQAEYALADKIMVLSTFAANSFFAQSPTLSRDKIEIVPLGTDLTVFEASDKVIKQRIERVRNNKKLQVLMAGGFSAQKGAADFIEVAASFSEYMDFSFVGSPEPDWHKRCQEKAPQVKFIDRVPQNTLPAIYAEYDIFYFPTVQDGFAAVIAQALTSGLCVIASENSAAPDIIENAKNGFVVPAQQSKVSIDLLLGLNMEREKIVDIIQAGRGLVKSRSWQDVARHFAEHVAQNIKGSA